MSDATSLVLDAAIVAAVVVALGGGALLLDWLLGLAWRPVRRSLEERRRLAALRGRR